MTLEQAKVAAEAVERVDKLRLQRALALSNKNNEKIENDHETEIHKKLEGWKEYQKSQKSAGCGIYQRIPRK